MYTLPVLTALLSLLTISPITASLSSTLTTTVTTTQLSCSAVNTLATQLYTYAFPLLLMNATSRNSAQNSLITALTQDPANHLVVKPNLDTAYTQGFFDVTNTTYLITFPVFSDDRYWIAQVLDGYSNTIADPGSRTINDTTQFSMLLTGQYTNITGIAMNATTTTQVVRSNTSLNWLLGRTYQNDTAADLALVGNLSAQWTVTTYPANSSTPTSVNIAGPVAQNSSATANLTAPIVTVASLNASRYFSVASQLMCNNPPAANDTDFQTSVVQPLGFNMCSAGSPFMNASAIYSCLPSNFTANALLYVQGQAVALGKNTTINGWPYIVHDIGTYGIDYTPRAVIALIGLGANLPIDAVYLSATADSAGKVLNASVPYTLTFQAGQLPPAEAFWSLTYYTNTSFLAPNAEGKNAVRSADPLVMNNNGSLTLYIQPAMPANQSLVVNWLPSVPTVSPTFVLTLRLYNPLPSAYLANHTWTPPPVMQQLAAM